MKSELFAQGNLENETQQRFALQNSQLLRVSLGPDVLAVKGAMVAYQGQVSFDHEGRAAWASCSRRCSPPRTSR